METTIQTINGVDVARLHGTMAAIGEDPKIADFKFRAVNEWQSGAYNVSRIQGFYGAKQEDTTRTQAHVLVADEPNVLLGTNNGANPTEALLHALAACITTTLVYHAAGRGIQLERVTSSYEGDLDLHGFLGLKPDVRPGFSAIRIKFRIEGDITEKEKRQVLRVGRRLSPVHDVVSRSVPIEVTLA